MKYSPLRGAGLIGIIAMVVLFVAFTVGSFYFWSASYEGTGLFTATSTSIIDVGINARNEALKLKKKLEDQYYGSSAVDTSTNSTRSTGGGSAE